ncbi:MAG: hypothetical protein ACKO54_23270, partial [Alphaproteobacteria bacterium]
MSTNFALNLCKIPEILCQDNLILPAPQDSCRVTGQASQKGLTGCGVRRRIHAARLGRVTGQA